MKFSCRVLVLSGLSLTGLLVACAPSPLTGRIPCAVCDESTRFVRIDAAPIDTREPRKRFDHPFRLEPKEWETLLRSIDVQSLRTPLLSPAIRGPAEQAFTEEDVHYLSETLRRTFIDAAPEEWVVFGLTRIGQDGLAELTSGAWYVEHQRVHLRLVNYRMAATMPGAMKLLRSNPVRPQPGGAYELVVNEHQTLLNDSATPGASLFERAPADLSIDFVPLLSTSLPSSVTSKPATVRDPPTSPLGSVEERLRRLKRFHDDGLISDTDYRAKKQQILDEF